VLLPVASKFRAAFASYLISGYILNAQRLVARDFPAYYGFTRHSHY